MMKTGHVEKTIDRDYEIEERRFRTMESAANRLQKEAKGYLDSLRGSIRSQDHGSKNSYDSISNSNCGNH
jgi:bridging integrator 3